MATTQWIDKSGTTTDIHDSRLPASLGTADQVLKMNSGATGIEWGTAGGGSLYEHKILGIYDSGDDRVQMNTSIVNASATPFTDTTFKALVASKYSGDSNLGLGCGGWMTKGTDIVEVPIYSVSCYYSSVIFWKWGSAGINVTNITPGSFNDTVTQIS